MDWYRLSFEFLLEIMLMGFLKQGLYDVFSSNLERQRKFHCMAYIDVKKHESSGNEENIMHVL